jgi:hypothetical protein
MPLIPDWVMISVVGMALAIWVALVAPFASGFLLLLLKSR